MPEYLIFETRAAFRSWLEGNCHSEKGVWLLFGKAGGPKTLAAAEALEEALCYGWVDGQMQSLDEMRYIKYFKQRNVKSNWSQKNKTLAAKLEAAGKMTDSGRAKITAAKANGSWDAPEGPALAPEQLAAFPDLLLPHPQARANYLKMTPSVQKSYAGSYYLGAKTEAGRAKAFERIVQRLALNLNPMESLQKALERQGRCGG